MELAIAQNPYSKKPQHLWDIISSQEEKDPRDDKIDRVGLRNLKMQLSKNPRFVVK